jgi:molecular chaperone HtpG
VLYFKDGVDDFVAKILMDYEGKKFKSVAENDFSVDSDVEKKELDQKAEQNKDLLCAIKDALDGKVKEVKLTANFKNYPVCITAAGDISIEMEKVFKSMPNADGKMQAEKILEISLEHGILDRLQTVYETDKEKLKKYATVLYEQARILAGLDIENPTEFVKAFSDII